LLLRLLCKEQKQPFIYLITLSCIFGISSNTLNSKESLKVYQAEQSRGNS
jgi:hypothetical protein